MINFLNNLTPQMHETKIRCTFELQSHNRVFVSESSFSEESEVAAAADVSNDSGLATDLPQSNFGFWKRR